MSSRSPNLSIAAAGMLCVGLFMGCKSEDPYVKAEGKFCVACTRCAASREVTSDELNKLFPGQSATTKATSVKCDKCGEVGLRPAFRCPRDGTIIIQRESGELMYEPCAQCAWTPSPATP